MSRLIQLAVSIALPMLVISALAPLRARGQTPASPPDNPFVDLAATGTPPSSSDDDGAPSAGEIHHARSTSADPPLEELAGAAVRSEPAPPPPEGAMRALDAVLSGDARDPLAGVEQAPEEAAASVGLPSRGEIAAAIARVTPSVRACATDQAGGVVEVRIVFTSNGRVTTASVETRSARLSPRQRSCVARAARRARIAEFERARFEVTYPVRL